MAYKLKEGLTSLSVAGVKGAITNKNLSDELAEFLLKKYPDLPIEKGEAEKPEAKGKSTPAKASENK